MIDKKNILGVNITNATKVEILEYIIKSLNNYQKKYYIVTPNPEFLVLANKNPKYRNILNSAELALPDGIGVILAGKILGKTLKQRITGIELLESLCKEVAEKPITVGFLGGGDGVAEKTADCLVKKYPGLKVAFAALEWSVGHLPHALAGSHRPLNDSSTSNLKQLQDVARKHHSKSEVSKESFKSSFRGGARPSNTPNSKSLIINHPSIDILFVAFGAPKQELWINENLQNMPVKVAIGVGGAFDYISGKVSRAPKWVRELGFEWLYRLIRQPWRLKRQLLLLKFVYMIAREKIKDSKQ